MTAAVWIGAGSLLLLLVALLLIPRLLLHRSQDRLAARLVEREQVSFQLLTRADLVAGRYRRIPGILSLAEGEIGFQGLFDESARIATSRIQKIATGPRLGSGRHLFRLEVLRITRSTGEEIEFVLSRAAANAWRSHLGLWAMQERAKDAASSGAPPGSHTVVPGRR